MINPREFLRRVLKFLIMFLILLITLQNTNKLNMEEIITICCIMTIIYCILDTMSPSINIVKK